MANTPKPSSTQGATPIVENLFAPEVFADVVVGAFLNNGNAHISFASRRADNSTSPATLNDVIIGRLVMPISAVENMVQFLDGWVHRMKQKASDANRPKVIQ